MPAPSASHADRGRAKPRLIPVVGRRIVSERRRQRLINGRLQSHNLGFSVSLLHLLRIEHLQLIDASLQPLDATALLIRCENGCLGWGAVRRVANGRLRVAPDFGPCGPAGWLSYVSGG